MEPTTNKSAFSTDVPGVQRAILHDRYGAAKAVLYATNTYPVVPPSPNQVQIRVHSASINPIDWQTLEGNRKLIASRSFPFVPFFDLSGTVVAVGYAVSRFKIGDAVHADNQKEGGGASEFVNVDQDLVSQKPALLSFAEAAAIPLAAQTALLTMDKGRVGKGSRVCIIGASGGVGSFAVQIAKALGASYILGVCSERNSGFVRALGADATLDYTTTKLSEVIRDRSIDVVIDCVGGRQQWVEAQAILTPKGRFVTIARDEDGTVTVASALTLIGTIMGRQLSSLWGKRIAYIPVFLNASHQLLDRVDELVSQGKVRVFLQTRYPFTLDGVLQLVGESKAGRMVGKSVIDIIPDKPATQV